MVDTAFKEAGRAHQQVAQAEAEALTRKLDEVRARQAFARAQAWAIAPAGTHFSTVQITTLDPKEVA